MGAARKPYVDHSGITWSAANYCQGGANVTVTPQKIEGTEDAPLYLGGVRGIAHCVFPVTQKLYEIHFHFAETTDLRRQASRLATLSINAEPPIGVDVVDDAGGIGIVTTSTVITGVAPLNDAAPSTSTSPVRSRCSTRSRSSRHAHRPVSCQCELWLDQHPISIAQTSSGRPIATSAEGGVAFTRGRINRGTWDCYESDRVGRFRYSIPAVPLAHYRVRLYFREPWFGKENGGLGGPGSRVFDVACNGEMLLKNFDILAEADSTPIVKTFDHIQATPGGRIELSFMPVVNYAVVNAIEVLPED